MFNNLLADTELLRSRAKAFQTQRFASWFSTHCVHQALWSIEWTVDASFKKNLFTSQYFLKMIDANRGIQCSIVFSLGTGCPHLVM